jgi:DNA-binding MarR family transcriptional regulator
MKLDDLTFYSVYSVLQTGMWLLNDLESYLKPFGLSQGRLAILLSILESKEGHINPKYIAEITGRSRPTIARMIEKLELKGLIEVKAVIEDARQKQVRLSSKGQALLEQIIPEYNKRIQQIVVELDKQDKQELLSLLVKLKFPGTEKSLVIPDELRRDIQ